MKPTTQDGSGTSFYDTTITATVNQLKSILDEPRYDGNDGKDKVNYEWMMETDNGHVFTVYDWKEYRSIKETEPIVWHIGGFNKRVTEQAKKEILLGLQNL